MSDSTNIPGEDNKKVRSLSTKRQQSAGKKLREERDEKISDVDIFLLYAAAINHKPLWRFAPMPFTYKVVKSTDNRRLIIRVGDEKLCRYALDEEVASAVSIYWLEHIKEGDTEGDLWLPPKKMKELVEYWKLTAEPLDMPAILAWSDEDIYCFRKLPFSYIRGASFPPLFFEFCSRLSNSNAFCKFIGSLFYPEADRQQYVWIYGEGGDGKGAIARLLSTVFGSAYQVLTSNSKKDAHWTEQLINCRIGVYADTNAAKYVTGGDFKSLTGNDLIRINPKNKPAYSLQLSVKLLLLSNERPELSSEKADMRRIIFCELQPPPGEADPQYELKLWNEAQDLLSFCRDMYEAHVSARGHSAIYVDPASLEHLSADEDDYFQGIFDKIFAKTNIKEEFVAAEKAMAKITQEIKNRIICSKFKSWMERTHGIKRIQARVDGEQRWQYSGVCLKPGGFY